MTIMLNLGVTRKDVSLAQLGEEYHYVHLGLEINEIVYDGMTGDVVQLTSNIIGLNGVYYETGPDSFIWYIPGFASSELRTLEYGKTYWISVQVEQDWQVPDYSL